MGGKVKLFKEVYFMPKITPLIKENKVLQREAERRDDLMGGEIEKWIRVSRLSKAEISVSVATTITGKVIQAYDKIMQMQI
jgi:flagellar hook-basal body complex protein FliE